MDTLTLKRKSAPEEFARHLQSFGPIHRAPEQFWIVTDHSLAITLLKHPNLSADRGAFFQSQMSGCPFHKVASFFGVVQRMMVNSDGATHLQRRRLGQSGISDLIIDRFSSQVRKIVADLQTAIQNKSEIEFVADVSLPLPCIVLADLFGIPKEERLEFYKSANHMTQFFGGGTTDIVREGELANAGAEHLRGYFSQVISKHRQNAGQNPTDFIGHLVLNAGSMDDDEVIAQSIIMLVAGSVTTTDQICNNLHMLLTTGIWNDLKTHPERLEAAIEEATRLDPAVNFVFRTVTDDFEIEGQSIRKGEIVFVSTHAANRSPKVFPEPHQFRTDRERNPHLSYGAGSHYCLGAKLGRLQMRELFSSMLKNFPSLRLHPSRQAVRKHQSLGFSGFETLPLLLEPK